MEYKFLKIRSSYSICVHLKRSAHLNSNPVIILKCYLGAMSSNMKVSGLLEYPTSVLHHSNYLPSPIISSVYIFH